MNQYVPEYPLNVSEEHVAIFDDSRLRIESRSFIPKDTMPVYNSVVSSEW